MDMPIIPEKDSDDTILVINAEIMNFLIFKFKTLGAESITFKIGSFHIY
jgi:hypothetical protein